jgi:hypothetical protein
MTNTALKAQIDSQITNETTQNSITPTEVGVNIKAVVDYADQEVALKESSANKSTDGTFLENSDVKFPSQKAVKTYVDSNPAIVTKVFKKTITQAQILQLYTTPITILDAFVSKLIYPTNIYIRRNIGNGYTLSNNLFSIVDEGNVVVESSIDSQFLTFNYSGSTGFTQKSISLNVSSGSDDRRYSYKLKANTANPTSGTGTIDVYVTYVEFSL